MDEIQYLGEHLWPGRLGQLAVTLAFVGSLLSAFAYFMSVKSRPSEKESENWKNLGRGAFVLHGLSVFSVIGILFYIMIGQFYEYQYVWAHVSEDLPLKYIASAFWEGQEGSFLLWMFWHVVLGLVLIVSAGKWESPVLALIALVQAFLGSMILGVYFFGDFRLGSSPLLLLRDAMEAPIFANADYLSMIKGSGLNPLLQNYWMTIHPPTLFLGFASTVVPFAFAIGGLWTGDHKSWMKPALPWALFSGAILGTGILMGGAWAYEALSFGGYWAWDPVENMSLVPWIILIGGIHTHLVARSTGRAIRSTYIYYILTFVLILYSTFLTRSGVLGDTSVHAFTEMGLEWQLIAFNLFPLLLGAVLLARQYKRIPSPEKEESLSSREFWMFIGTLVLLFSAVLITASTSLPVFNKIVQAFDPTFEGRVITDPIPHYNKYQIWIAIFISLLSGAAQFLRYKERNFKGYARKFGLHMGGALALSGLFSWLVSLWIDLFSWQYVLLLFASLFVTFTNLDYLITFARRNLKAAGANFAHMGFGIMIIGVLASGLNQQIISSNQFLMDGLIEGDADASKRNILLFKDTPVRMGDYTLTYTGDTLDNFTRTYTVNYVRRNQQGQIVEEFDLHPNILYEKSFQKIAASNPSTKHYLTRDIFTHIASLPTVEINLEEKRKKEAELNYRTRRIVPGDTLTFRDTVPIKDQDTFALRDFRITRAEIDYTPSHPEYEPQPGDLAIGLNLQIGRADKLGTQAAKPVILVRGNSLYTYPVQVNELGMRVRLTEAALDALLIPEEELDYQPYLLQPGQSFEHDNLSMRFERFSKNPAHSAYVAQQGDIAVSAVIEARGSDGETYTAEPVYFIRNNRPFNLKAHIPELGLHFRFMNIDPEAENLNLMVAKSEAGASSIPVEIATNSLRTDYIVLEAIEFPGINLFWLGSILMMVGLLLSMIFRIGQKRRTAPA